MPWFPLQSPKLCRYHPCVNRFCYVNGFFTVLQPAIDMLTEPDYINQKIIQYLEAQKEVDAMHVRTHEYAKTFEDYIRLINNCDNVDTLKRLRWVNTGLLILTATLAVISLSCYLLGCALLRNILWIDELIIAKHLGRVALTLSNSVSDLTIRFL